MFVVARTFLTLVRQVSCTGSKVVITHGRLQLLALYSTDEIPVRRLLK
jgi:hypothetical protein